MSRPFDIKALPNGHEIVTHPGSVAIIPLLEIIDEVFLDCNHYSLTNRVILCEQQRSGTGRRMLEIPAGTRDINGESPIVTAVREMEEEIGYRPSFVSPLGIMHPSPGYCSETICLYLGGGLKKIESDREFEPIIMPVGEVLDCIADDVITDAKTIVAFHKWRLLFAALSEKVIQV